MVRIIYKNRSIIRVIVFSILLMLMLYFLFICLPKWFINSSMMPFTVFLQNIFYIILFLLSLKYSLKAEVDKYYDAEENKETFLNRNDEYVDLKNEINLSRTIFLGPISSVLFFIFLIFGIIWLIVHLFGQFYAILAFFPLLWLLSYLMLMSVMIISPFEKKRNVLASKIGINYQNMMTSEPGYFRILVYSDAIEIRSFFQQFLIPYSEIKEIRYERGHLVYGITVVSNIPNIPEVIRCHSIMEEGMENVINKIEENRKAFIEN